MDTTILNKKIQELHEDHRNRDAIVEILPAYLILGGTLSCLRAYPSWITFILSFFVIGLMQYRIVMSCHEAVHKTLFFSLWINECVGWIHSAMVGLNFILYRHQHLSHHWAKTISEDPDGYIYQPFLATKDKSTRLKVFVFGALNELVEKFKQKGAIPRQFRAMQKQAYLHSFFMVGVNILIFLLFNHLLAWWAFFIFWLLPNITIALFLNRTRVIIEHGYLHTKTMNSSIPVDERLQSTIDLVSHPVERYLLAPFDFNYHYAHHKKPSIPYYNNARHSQLLKASGDSEQHYLTESYLSLLSKMIHFKT